MTEYRLCIKPGTDWFGEHDPSAVIFTDNEVRFGVEEERYTRQKHARGEFPTNAIEACLGYCNIDMGDVDEVILSRRFQLESNLFRHRLRRSITEGEGPFRKLDDVYQTVRKHVAGTHLDAPTENVRTRLAEIGTPVPPIKTEPHHKCHAASAFHPSGFDEALVLTIDGMGEYDSTVVWRGTPDGLERLWTYEFPNSLGKFYGMITEYLGYYPKNGEGKVMGLAPYGERDETIEERFRSVIETGAEYDVTQLTAPYQRRGVAVLEELFDRPATDTPGEFDQWEKDLARVTQALLEETVTEIAEKYLPRVGTEKVALAGGVALNCKMNKCVMELDGVDEVFIQPVAHDGGLPLGAGMLQYRPSDVPEMDRVYWGPEYDTSEIREMLDTNKIPYHEPDDLERYVAEAIAGGSLVGWFQGRLEMGPRALGNRSILADPRTAESRDRVNRYVKHREGWRPFAPSMTLGAAERYLVGGQSAPYMIRTFDTDPATRDDLEAVVHPADRTTRPQTVTETQNPRYHRLIEEFADITGVPVVLNTSFNDHAEPIVRTPTEALKDFFGMGLDILVLEDLVVEKPEQTP